MFYLLGACPRVGGGGAARRRSWDGEAGWKFKLFNLSDDCPIKNCQVYYCFS